MKNETILKIMIRVEKNECSILDEMSAFYTNVKMIEKTVFLARFKEDVDCGR